MIIGYLILVLEESQATPEKNENFTPKNKAFNA